MSRNGGHPGVVTSDDSLNTSFLLRAFIGGIAAVFLAMIIEYSIGFALREYRYDRLIMASIIAPITEESVKALAAIYIAKRIHPASGFFVGLSFGIIETLAYAATFGVGVYGFLLVTYVRSFLSIPIHVMTSSMFLYGLYVREQGLKEPMRFRILSAYLIHGLYNFSLSVMA